MSVTHGCDELCVLTSTLYAPDRTDNITQYTCSIIPKKFHQSVYCLLSAHKI
jgi:hypothetical protein